MEQYLKFFKTSEEYSGSTEKPSVAHIVDEVKVIFVSCSEETIYELVGTPLYPSEIEGCDTGFTLSFNYKKTEINKKCKETVTEGSESVIIETGTNPSKSANRTISDVYDFHGLEVPYSITQKPTEPIVTLNLYVPTSGSVYVLDSFNDKYLYDYIQIDDGEKISNSNFSTYAPGGQVSLSEGDHVMKIWLTNPSNVRGFAAKRNITGATIPCNVESMSNTFYDTSGLTRFDMPNSVTKLYSQAFSGCRALTAVTLSENLTEFGYQTFYYCQNLAGRVVLPDSVTSIGQASFYSCRKMTDINIPEGVTVIKNATFSDCIALNDVELPSSVSTLEGQAFWNCKNFKNIYVGENLINISHNAYENCSSVTAVTVSPDNPVYDSRNNCNALIETATNTLFFGCQNTVIPDDIEIIDQYAFYNVTGITSVDLPNTVNSIGYYAFSGCYDLTSITMSDNVTVINAAAFQSCSGLSNCVLSNNVTELGSNMFSGCKSLTQLTLPSSLTIIGNGTFRDCGFSAVDIPSGVTSIDNYAFASCTNLRSLTVRATTPPTLSSTAIQGLSSELKIYVPAESVSAYKSASRWSTYKNQIYAIQ